MREKWAAFLSAKTDRIFPYLKKFLLPIQTIKLYTRKNKKYTNVASRIYIDEISCKINLSYRHSGILQLLCNCAMNFLAIVAAFLRFRRRNRMRKGRQASRTKYMYLQHDGAAYIVISFASSSTYPTVVPETTTYRMA